MLQKWRKFAKSGHTVQKFFCLFAFNSSFLHSLSILLFVVFLYLNIIYFSILNHLFSYFVVSCQSSYLGRYQLDSRAQCDQMQD